MDSSAKCRITAPGEWTIAVDEDGKELGRWPDLLVQVKEGADFYIGQVPWLVSHIDYEEGDDRMTIYLRSK